MGPETPTGHRPLGTRPCLCPGGGPGTGLSQGSDSATPSAERRSHLNPPQTPRTLCRAPSRRQPLGVGRLCWPTRGCPCGGPRVWGVARCGDCPPGHGAETGGPGNPDRRSGLRPQGPGSRGEGTRPREVPAPLSVHSGVSQARGPGLGPHRGPPSAATVDAMSQSGSLSCCPGPAK